MLSRAAALESVRQSTRTAAAGAVSLYVTNQFGLPEGYWAAISALIVMQSNVGATLSAARTRLAGTAVGAVVGGLFVALFGRNAGVGGLLEFALAVTISFFLCDLLRLTDSQRLATVTVAIIMLIGHDSAAWIIAVHRFSEVALGILIALLVSLTVWPSHARTSLRQGFVTALASSELFLHAIVERYRGHDSATVSIESLRAQVRDILRKNADLLKNALQEPFAPSKQRESLALLATQVERIFTALEMVEFAVRDSRADTYVEHFATGLKHLETGLGEALESLAGSIPPAHQLAPMWPDLAGMFGLLEDQAAAERNAGALRDDHFNAVLRFDFLIFTSRNLVQELTSARAIAGEA